MLDEIDMMLKCPSCGQMHYPRIAPAIIVAVRKGYELLMAKHSYHNTDRYTLVAGFFMLFWFESSYFSYGTEWYGYNGLFMMILGPIVVRIVYESLMLALIAVKNIIQINNKLKNIK